MPGGRRLWAWPIVEISGSQPPIPEIGGDYTLEGVTRQAALKALRSGEDREHGTHEPVAAASCRAFPVVEIGWLRAWKARLQLEPRSERKVYHRTYRKRGGRSNTKYTNHMKNARASSP